MNGDETTAGRPANEAPDLIESISDVPYLRAQVLIARGREGLAESRCRQLQSKLDAAELELATIKTNLLRARSPQRSETIS